MPYVFCSFGEGLPVAGFCLAASTPAVTNLLAGLLAEHSLIFERRGGLLELVGPQEPVRIVEFLRHTLTESERREIRVISTSASGFPEQHSLDDWWGISETGWFDDAIGRDRFSTLFQPVVDTTLNRVFGHECLIHFQTKRNFSGAEIVEAARLRNQVRTFDAHARRLAVASAAQRGGSGIFFINLLATSLYQPERCLESTFQAVGESGLQASRFVFEVVNPDQADPSHLRAIAEAVRARGCGFGLDDTGSGMTRLISDLRPDYIKLAASLIAEVEAPSCASLIHRLVETAEQAGTTTIAKNVESARTMENLWLLGVQNMQGYFFGRPSSMPAQQPTDLLNLASALEPSSVLFPTLSN